MLLCLLIFLSGIYDVQDSSFNLVVWFWTVAIDEIIFLFESSSSFPCISVSCWLGDYTS